MLENTQNISLEGRDATIPQFYNHPRLPKDRVTCCIISKRQRARCHSLDFSQALMVALKLMISGCTSFADFMYSKAWRDLPSFHPERNVLCVINQQEDEIWNLISMPHHINLWRLDHRYLQIVQKWPLVQSLFPEYTTSEQANAHWSKTLP